jgi:hypothetical protein
MKTTVNSERYIGFFLTLGLSLTIISTAARGGGAIPDTFRGLRFRTDFTKQMPECRKCPLRDSSRLPAGEVYCPEYDALPTEDKTHKACWQLTAPPRLYTLIFFDKLSDEITNTFAEVEDSKLMRVTFLFHAKFFPTLAALFKDKYGAPTATSEKPWQSKGGVRTKAYTHTWKSKTLHIELKVPGDRLDDGEGELVTPEYISTIQRYREEVLRKQRKDL